MRKWSARESRDGKIAFRVLMVIVFVAIAFLRFACQKVPTIAHGVGHQNVQLDFVVIDAESGGPVKGATIKLDELLYGEPQSPPGVVELQTGHDGRASVVLYLMVYNSWEVETQLPQSFAVHYPWWEMKVTADGYQGFKVWFKDYEKLGDGFMQNPRPGPIHISLRRVPQVLGR